MAIHQFANPAWRDINVRRKLASADAGKRFLFCLSDCRL